MTETKKSRKKRILIVDDDQIIAHLGKEVLESKGFKVELAQDGVEGLKKIKKNKYDVIISDFDMPGMKGDRFYLEVKKLNKSLEKRIIFASGFKNDFIRSTGNRFLAKPFSPNQLWELVRDFIEGDM